PGGAGAGRGGRTAAGRTGGAETRLGAAVRQSDHRRLLAAAAHGRLRPEPSGHRTASVDRQHPSGGRGGAGGRGRAGSDRGRRGRDPTGADAHRRRPADRGGGAGTSAGGSGADVGGDGAEGAGLGPARGGIGHTQRVRGGAAARHG
ncbi:hypothetical protein LTR94_032526, partial [Friedmanniomyces endolithicus]